MINALRKLAVVLPLLLGCGTAWGQPAEAAQSGFGPPAPIPGGMGIITYVDHTEGEISINERDYTFRPDQIRVTYLDDQTGRLVFLQEGTIVRFSLDQDGNVVHVNLVGPPNRIDEIVNR